MMPRIRSQMWLCLALAAATSTNLGAAATPSPQPASCPAGESDRLIVLRDGWLSEVVRGTSGSGWQERRLAPLPETGSSYPDWSGPEISPTGVVLVAHSGASESDKWEERTAVSLHTWTKGQTALTPGPQFRRPEGHGGLDGWVQSERLFTFRVGITGGYAATQVVRLKAKGEAAVGSAADDSERRVRDRFGRNTYLTAAAYSGDGRFFAGASGSQIAVYDRRSHHIRIVETPVKYVWCTSFSDDGKAIAWIGEVGKSNPVPSEESGGEYIPNLDAVGVTWVCTGETSVYRVGKLTGYEGIVAFGDQNIARIRINSMKDAFYFLWERGLARLGRSDGKLEVVAREVDGFGLAP